VSPTPLPADLNFDQATALTPGQGEGTFDTMVHELWTVGDKPNGGYLLALLARAAGQRVGPTGPGELEPVAASVTYLGAPELASATITTTLLRQGRTAAHVRSVLAQDDRTLVDAVFVMSGLGPAAPPRYSDVAPLDCPPPEDCVRLPSQIPGGIRVGILETTEVRLDPATVPTAPIVDDSPAAELRGWLRFTDGRAPDPLSLHYFVDAVPPATLRIGSNGWVPTLQMSTYARALPAPGWLGIRLTAHLVTGGMVDETCTLWDSQGHLVAQATQLARLRFPDETS
jgi:hypothetical protein